MTLPWIRVDIDLPSTPEADLLESALGVPRAWTYVVQLWLWAARHAPDGDLSSVPNPTIARRAGWTGDPEQFASALIASGFLGTTGMLAMWVEQQAKRAERAEKDAERKREERSARAQRRGKPAKKPSAGRPQDVHGTSDGPPQDVGRTGDGRPQDVPRTSTSYVTERYGTETNTKPPPTPSRAPTAAPTHRAAPEAARGGQAYEDRAWSQRAQASTSDNGDIARRATQRLLRERAETEKFVLLEGLAEGAGVELPPMRGTPAAAEWLAAHGELVQRAERMMADRQAAA